MPCHDMNSLHCTTWIAWHYIHTHTQTDTDTVHAAAHRGAFLAARCVDVVGTAVISASSQPLIAAEL